MSPATARKTATYDPSRKNVFSGPNALIDYYHPDKNPPLPLVELPRELSPFYDDGVRIYAKMLTALPATNVKSLPALNMLEQSGVISLDGRPDEQKTTCVVESSSGSTVTAMSILARQHGIKKVRAYMSNKVSPTKARTLRFFGLELALFGGPSQSPPQDKMGGIAKAAAEGSNEGVYNPNQYVNRDNLMAHERWTAKQLLEQLPEINVFAAGMGTGGTITGTGKGLKATSPDMHVIGVCVAPGDKVPGPRPRELLEPVDFEWKDVVDSVEDVTSKTSYALSMELCRWGIVSGPSSGFSLQGLYQVLERRKREGTLAALRQQNDGRPIECVFLCCDLPFQYVDEYFDKCPEHMFAPIVNEELFKVDQYAYSTTWILDYSAAMTMLVYPRFPLGMQGSGGSPSSLSSSPSSSDGGAGPLSPGLQRPAIIDLRSRRDFAAEHLDRSCHLPLSSLRQDDPSPYEDPALLTTQWTELNARFMANHNGTAAAAATGSPPPVAHRCPPNGVGELAKLPIDEVLACLRMNGREALVIDYNGETARLAASVLRKAGIKAFSVEGGFDALKQNGCPVVSSAPVA